MNKRLLFNKTNLIIIGLISIAFAVRMIPHLMVYRWIACEEELVYRVVDDLIVLGQPREGYNLYNPLTTYGVYYLHLITQINPIFLAQIFNPIMGALTTIPLYLLAKRIIGEKGAVLSSFLYVFSEVAIYRQSSFGSVEPIGILFAVSTLYFYHKGEDKPKMFLFMGICYILTFFGHILPFIWLSGVLFLDSLLFGKIKKKILVGIVTIIGMITLYTPLLPYQAVRTLIQPESILSSIKLSNLFVYGINDLLITGLSILLGSAILIGIALFVLIKFKEKGIVFSMFLSAFLLFIYAYIGYNSFIISPVRLVLYLVLPSLLCVASFLLKIKPKIRHIFTVLIIIGIVISLPFGFEKVLWLPYSLTKGEYCALSVIQPYINKTSVWYSDYPAIVSILAHSSKDWKVTVNESDYNSPTWIDKIRGNFEAVESGLTANITRFEEFNFKYVFYSERIQKNGLFLRFKSDIAMGRNTYAILQITDIWYNNTNWNLIYNEDGVKVYERLTL